MIKELEAFADSLPLSEREIIKRVSKGEDLEILDLNVLRANYRSIERAFAYTKIYSAVKALSVQEEIPHIAPKGGMIGILKSMGSCFEVATIEEFRKIKSMGIPPDHILFTHPDKDALEVKESYEGGLRHYVSDSLSDVKRLAEQAPGSEVLIRITSRGEGTGKWFNNRFGVFPRMAKQLLREAKALSLRPCGLAFHVGTQAEDPRSWENPLQMAGGIFKEMAREGLPLRTLSLGGGFPALNKKILLSYEKYAKRIKSYLADHFSPLPQTIIIEPGRALSGMTGVTIGRVINVKWLGQREDSCIITLSTGQYSAGMNGIGYKMNFYLKEGSESVRPSQGPYVKADVYGKACSSMDVVEKGVSAPKNLKSGDLAVFSGTGAYSAHTASSSWCGRPSPTRIIFDSAGSK